MNLRVLCLCLVQFGVSFSGPCLAQEIVQHGRQVGGSYDFGDVRLHYFAFTYKGELNAETTGTIVAKVVGDVRKENTSANAQSFSKFDRKGQYSEKVAMNEGDVFVLGWVLQDGTKLAWVAADQAGEWIYAKHRWISSTGKTGTILAQSEPHVKREQKTVKLDFQIGKAKPRAIYLQLYAQENHMVWWMPHPADGPRDGGP